MFISPLAAAKLNLYTLFHGADLDDIRCKMALINMLLNSLQDEIAHINSLSNEFFIGYKVCTTLVDDYHMPYYTEFLEVEQSYIWLKPVKEQLWSAFSIPFELLRAS